MRPPAGLEVEALGLHQADGVARLLGGVNAQRLGLAAGHDAGGHVTGLPHDLVAAALGAPDGLVAHGAGEVDGGIVRPQVEADGGRARRVHEGAGEQVLAVVLLHVVAAALGVHAAVHAVGLEGGGQHVQHLAAVLHHRHHRHAVQGADVPGLAAALRVEGGAIEDEGGPSLVAAAPHHGGLELHEVRVFPVQPLGHARAAVTTTAPWPPRT